MFGIYDENGVLLLGGFPTAKDADRYATDEMIRQRDVAGLPTVPYSISQERHGT